MGKADNAPTDRGAYSKLKAIDGVAAGQPAAPNKARQDGAGKGPAGETALPDGAAPPAPDSLPHKIIYTAKVDLNVADFDQASDQLDQLAKTNKGYVAQSYVNGSPGSPRTGSWTVRVPVEHFEAFLREAEKLGELHSAKVDSEDITDKFYDLKAHIKTNKVEEESLQKLLIEKAPNSKLEDLVAVRRELRTIRGEIEQQEGRLNRWDKESQLATCTITLTDQVGYVPPGSPSFGTSVSRTFNGSIDAMITVGKALVLVVVAVAPWLAGPVVVTALLVLWFRRTRASKPAGPVPPDDAPELSAV